jgi:Zn-dependent peptidase ImmA (M78 family)
MKVNICGIPHNVLFVEDTFDSDAKHFGQIDYVRCLITVNSDLREDARKETICHEMVHGMLVHMGYDELSQDEQFVQALGNAICQGFEIKAGK